MNGVARRLAQRGVKCSRLMITPISASRSEMSWQARTSDGVRTGIGVAFVVAAAVCAACSRAPSPAPPQDAASAVSAGEWFVDRAAASGLDFTHFNGMSGAMFYAEHMGP